DVDQDAFDVRIGGDALERGRDLLLGGAAAHVEKVRGRSAVELDDVHGRHGETGAVDHAADSAFQRDVVEIVFGRLDLFVVFLAQVAQRGNVGVAIKRVVVEANLGVETDQLPGLGDDERIDLEETHVLGEERLIELGEYRGRLFGEVAGEAEHLGGAPPVVRQEAGRRI